MSEENKESLSQYELLQKKEEELKLEKKKLKEEKRKLAGTSGEPVVLDKKELPEQIDDLLKSCDHDKSKLSPSMRRELSRLMKKLKAEDRKAYEKIQEANGWGRKYCPLV